MDTPPLDKLSYNKLLQEYRYHSDTLKLFDEAYWIGALSASEEIKEQCGELHKEAFHVQRQLEKELARRTLERIGIRLNLLKNGLSFEEHEQKHQKEGAP